MSRYLYILSFSAIAVSGCKKPYSPAVVSSNNNYLVVEGVIAAGQDSTIIKLSRTVNISKKTNTDPEINAKVTIVGDQNVTYNIPQINNGKYAVAALNLDNTHKYCLKIITADGRTYSSAYEIVKITPPIDTLEYNITNTGVDIFTNAHDHSNNTRYYRWDYAETYIYTSTINSDYIYDPTQRFDTLKSVKRTPDQQVHTCYVTLNSSTIILNSSVALKQDIINNNPITQISSTSEKLSHRYSILVKQYALTANAYAFWNHEKNNTEKLGNIFDPQPSEIKGNIQCTSDPSEPVIGYISVSTISQKRIFIDKTELPVWPYTPPTCKPIGICWYKGGQPVDPDIVSGNYIPVGLIMSSTCGDAGKPGYVVSAAEYSCVDCRYHLGGITKVPDFWK